MTKRVVLYGRHSSDLQNPKSAADQIAFLRHTLNATGADWVVVGEERDEAVTGTSMCGRAGLDRIRARASVRPRPFDAILVEDVSRFSRNLDDASRVREELRSHGVAVLSAAECFQDPDSDAGRISTVMLQLMAEMASRDTGRRVLRAGHANTMKGYRTGGVPPFGYKAIPDPEIAPEDRAGRRSQRCMKLVPDPIESPVITYVFKRFADGVGTKAIVTELEDKEKPYHLASPKPYNHTTIRDWLLRPVYLGHTVYGRTRDEKYHVDGKLKRRKVRLPEEEWIICENTHEPLVDQATWDAVQAIFSKNKRKGIGGGQSRPRGGRSRRSILSGLVRCARCSGNFVIQPSGPNAKQKKAGNHRSTYRFACNTARTYKYTRCQSRVSIERGRMERALLAAIQEQVLTEGGLAYLHQKRQEYLRTALRAQAQQADGLRKRRAQLQREQANLLQALKTNPDLPRIVSDELRRLADEQADLDRQLEGVEHLERLQDEAIENHLERTRVAELEAVLAAPNLEKVRRCLVALIEGLEVREDDSVWLLVGEGPLGTDDLRLALDGESPEADKTTTGHERDARSRSLVSMVGATGLEPATS